MNTVRLIKGYAGFYYVECEDSLVTCKARGVFRKHNEKPVIGDYVVIDIADGEGTIVEILPRKNVLRRPPVSNIDCVAVTVAVKSPQADLLLLDKLLIQAQTAGVQAIICVNKCDLSAPDELISVYKNTGFEVFPVSAKTGAGIERLASRIKGICLCFAGQSGVGKSSIINRLSGREHMETGEIGQKSDRGKHTTRHVELLPVNGGYIVDTPGFSLLDSSGLPDDLDRYYPEFLPYIGSCRFVGCEHRTEPDCAVKEHCRTGEISGTRYDQYLKLLSERKNRNNL